MEGKRVELSATLELDENNEINSRITLNGNTVDMAEAWTRVGAEIAERLGFSYGELAISSCLFVAANGDPIERTVINMKAFDVRPEHPDDHERVD
jgi:hypothetical protein